MPKTQRMSPPASSAAKRAQRARANGIIGDPPGTGATADAGASWATSPATRKAMQANRRRDTAPEMAIRRLVHASGLRYRVDARPLTAARHTADMIFTRAQVAVFIDGCWWHGCAEHYRPPASNTAYWADKVTRNRERDQLANEALTAAGWTVIRVWEHEAPESAAGRIRAVVRNAAPVRSVSRSRRA
jgi:DNA mismatch endonuclease (patch repair protein)